MKPMRFRTYKVTFLFHLHILHNTVPNVFSIVLSCHCCRARYLNNWKTIWEGRGGGCHCYLALIHGPNMASRADLPRQHKSIDVIKLPLIRLCDTQEWGLGVQEQQPVMETLLALALNHFEVWERCRERSSDESENIGHFPLHPLGA